MTYNILADLQHYEVLDEAATIKLFKDYNKGNLNAREKLILHNLRFVIYIQRKYDYNLKNEDLTQVGIIGLIKAIETFKIEKEILFVTYARHCIENEIKMFYRKNHKHDLVLSLNESVIDISNEKLLFTYEESLIDPQTNIEAMIENMVNKNIIDNAINSLPNKIKYIIKLFYGIDSETRYTQKEIAKLLGYSQPYISRIIQNANDDIKRKILKSGY